MYYAVNGFKKQTDFGKYLVVYLGVAVFILCGFEHCIADMYFGVAGLLAAGKFQIAAGSLTWARFCLGCLLPVTIGNLIGGAGIVGCGYYFAYLHRTPMSHETAEEEEHDIYIAEEY